MMNHVTNAETADSHWKGLYKVGGVAALIMEGMAVNENHKNWVTGKR